MKFLFTLLLAATLLAQSDPHPSARLNWLWSQGSGDPATGFHVWRSATAGGPYTTPYATVLGSSTLTYLDTAVVAGQTYYYVVSAYNAGGDSSKTSEVSCTIPFQAPVSPTSLSGIAK